MYIIKKLLVAYCWYKHFQTYVLTFVVTFLCQSEDVVKTQYHTHVYSQILLRYAQVKFAKTTLSNLFMKTYQYTFYYQRGSESVVYSLMNYSLFLTSQLRPISRLFRVYELLQEEITVLYYHTTCYLRIGICYLYLSWYNYRVMCFNIDMTLCLEHINLGVLLKL